MSERPTMRLGGVNGGGGEVVAREEKNRNRTNAEQNSGEPTFAKKPAKRQKARNKILRNKEGVGRSR